MNRKYDTDLACSFREAEGVKKKWGWFLVLGLLLIVLGALAMSSKFYVTLFSVFFLGILLLGTGVVQIFTSFWARKWSGLFLSILLGILYLVVGFLCVTQPALSAISLTLLIAAFCFIGGLFRMIIALFLRFDHWGWVFFNGLVTFILGVLIYAGWPVTGLWVIGLFVGIDMVLLGLSWVFLGLTAKNA